MGCDIHAFFEVKLKSKWHCYTQPNIARDYRLFGKMAGVRGDGRAAIAPGRGLPADISAVVQFEANHWEGDGHSHSWLTSPEIAELSEWLTHEGGDMETDWGCYLVGNSFEDFEKYPAERPPGLEGVRLVFWFDN